MNILKEQEFEYIRDYIHDQSGMFLDDTKTYLIRQRVGGILKQFDVSSFKELVVKMKFGLNFSQKEILISAITTNETFFFRDNHPFETFYTYLMPKLLSVTENQGINGLEKKKNIWCAGCSTGQEPYSLAILINEYIKNKSLIKKAGNYINITATDIDIVAIAYAKKGLYTRIELDRGLSKSRQNTYFTKEKDNWKIKTELTEMINFYQLSLLKNISGIFFGKFDVIFARNVLIYFNEKTRNEIINQFFRILNSDGYLILGSSENLYGYNELFVSENVGNTILYKKIGNN